MTNQRSKLLVLGEGTFLGTALFKRLGEIWKGSLFDLKGSEGQLMDRKWVANLFASTKPEAVILAGGPSGGILENQRRGADLLINNLAVEMTVLGEARRSKVKRVLYFGSSCMYPRQAPQPMKESDLWAGPVEPTSRSYAVAKLAGLEMGLAFDRQDGTRRFMAVIPNSVYGPEDTFDAQSGHVVAAMISRFHEAKTRGRPSVWLWGSGAPRREFVHVNDVADACSHLLSLPWVGLSSPVNIGVGRDWSIAELAEKVRRSVGFKGGIRWDRSKPDGAPRKWLDCAVLFRTGWRPRMSLEEGLRDTYAHYARQVARS